ncbi:hypothetical protein [Criibacterium bergeronii]|uniref:hypothetical protein n=1 Tax=Criibacterium bergeronii TaxID=1871336 RepID=UPI003F696326
MMNELKELLIDGAKYNYDPDTEYIKEGHAYCKVCNERKDGEVMYIFGSKKIFKRQCECDRNRLKKKLREKNSKKLKI